MARYSWVFFAIAALAALAVADAAISCQDVTNALNPCFTFVLYGGSPAGECCQNIQGIYSHASAASDKQIVCNCLKGYSSYAATNPNILHNAAALPGLCGLRLPYTISPNIDCASVH